MNILAYCGPAPLPEELLGQWNLDPWLIAGMLLCSGLHLVLLRREPAVVRRRKLQFAAGGWGLLALLFISPLCALTSALFSARIAHHMLMLAVAAPLLALALPRAWQEWRVPPGASALVFGVHTVLLWVWHAPAPYTAALTDPRVFWAMELSLLGPALLLWCIVLAGRSDGAGLGRPLALLLATVVQMGLLGAIITFAPTPLYLPHLATTMPWGLTPLADQQLAGLIMWVPATVPYLAAAIVLLGLWLSRGHAERSQYGERAS